MVTKPLILVYSMLDLRVDSFGFHAEMSRTGKFVAEPAWWKKKIFVVLYLRSVLKSSQTSTWCSGPAPVSLSVCGINMGRINKHCSQFSFAL